MRSKQIILAVSGLFIMATLNMTEATENTTGASPQIIISCEMHQETYKIQGWSQPFNRERDIEAKNPPKKQPFNPSILQTLQMILRAYNMEYVVKSCEFLYENRYPIGLGLAALAGYALRSYLPDIDTANIDFSHKTV